MKTGSADPSHVSEVQPSLGSSAVGQHAACGREGGRGSGAAQEPPSQLVGNSLQSHPQSLWDSASF